MKHTNNDVIQARIEELLFAIDMIENHDKPKIMLFNKIDDLIEISKKNDKEN